MKAMVFGFIWVISFVLFDFARQAKDARDKIEAVSYLVLIWAAGVAAYATAKAK